MQLQIKDLDRINGIYKKVKKLDEQIIQLNQKAMMLAETPCEVKFSMSISNPQPPEDKDSDVIARGIDNVTGYGIEFIRPRLHDLIASPWGSIYGINPQPPEDKKSKNKSLVDAEVTESEALAILGILLGNKMRKRDALIKQLADMGIQ